jgi:hypothetical protein
MERFTLEKVLASQDLGHTSIDAVCDSVLNDNYEVGEDLITGYIVEKFISNGFVNSSTPDRDQYAIDLKYAIDQLQRALKVINDSDLV